MNLTSVKLLLVKIPNTPILVVNIIWGKKIKKKSFNFFTALL
jgi:hypothetical protein